MKIIAALLMTQSLLATLLSAAPVDSLVDVLPLHGGNAWTYKYTSKTFDQLPFMVYTDSGTVHLEITGVTSAQDTARWTVKERRNLQRQTLNPSIPSDSTYPVVGSTTYSLIEVLLAGHRVYRDQSESAIWNSVAPWFPELSDTSSIFRHAVVDDSGYVRLASHSSSPHPRHDYYFTFKEGIGLTAGGAVTGSYITGLIERVDYTLTGQVITSVRESDSSKVPSNARLFQYYPNPFNPSTLIRYSLPARMNAKLEVFNTLGQREAILINETQDAGIHEARLQGGNLASGVKFIRLSAGGHVAVTKGLLLR